MKMLAILCGLIFLVSSAFSHEELHMLAVDEQDVECGPSIPEVVKRLVNCSEYLLDCGKFAVSYNGSRNKTMKEYQISAFGTYLYIGKSNTLVDGGSGNPVFMLQNNDTRTGKRIGLIHQYDLYGWIGLNSKIGNAVTWIDLLGQNFGQRPVFANCYNANDDRVVDCNKKWQMQIEVGNWSIDDGVHVTCEVNKTIGDSWANEGACIADGKDQTCGPGMQNQMRTCIDGTCVDKDTIDCKCSKQDKEKRVTCKEAGTALDACSTSSTTTKASTEAETGHTKEKANTTSTKSVAPSGPPTTDGAVINNHGFNFLVGMIMFVNIIC